MGEISLSLGRIEPRYYVYYDYAKAFCILHSSDGLEDCFYRDESEKKEFQNDTSTILCSNLSQVGRTSQY